MKVAKLVQVVGFLLCAAGAVSIGGQVAPEWSGLLLANVRACANRARCDANFFDRWLRRHEPPIRQFMDDDDPPPDPKRLKR